MKIAQSTASHTIFLKLNEKIIAPLLDCFACPFSQWINNNTSHHTVKLKPQNP
jgi:hypothetical protein